MTDLLMQYGLFLAQAVTVVAAVGAIAAIIVTAARRDRGPEKLEIKALNERYEDMARTLKRATLNKKAFKAYLKAEKARHKAREKESESAGDKRLFVLNFHGDIKATAVASLREEVTAILGVASPQDEVLLRLENAGGLVHEHGLAASQLMRIKERGLTLTVAVDKVAASGGYMMACVADRILAAPFAILGSIGVLAQIPNFHRLLDRSGVDFEQIKAGEYKRTVTVFGKNSDEGRAKLQSEVEDTHALFKDFVLEQRAGLDIDRVASGEHWYGQRALGLKLVDELKTSDDHLLAASADTKIYEVSYSTRKSVGEKMAAIVQLAADKLLLSWWGRAEAGRYTR